MTQFLYPPLKGEGDINFSASRDQWRARQSDAARRLLDDDERYFLHQSLSTPCLQVLESCEGIYIQDVDGKRYMDFHGNNVHQVGYRNPYVIEAVKEQLDILPFSPRRFTNRPSIELARKLAELAPGSLNKVLFAPGATSAIGMALKLARLVTGKHKTLSMWDAFHGASLDALSVGGEALFRSGLGPLMPGSEHVPPFNSYRSSFGQDNDEELSLRYLQYVLEKEAGEIGAVIIETVRNTDVQIPPMDYYKKVRALCDRHGALLILDETAIALGRTGTMFAFEHYGVEPDMVVIGKGLGGGVMPLAALIVKEHLDIAGYTSLGHYTHEKSPLGAVAALATIRYIEENQLLQHVLEMETYLRKELLQLQHKHNLIGDIRLIGMLAGIELVTNRVTKEKAVDEAEKILYHCLERGLSFKVSQGNVLSLYPPLITSKGQLQVALSILDEAFTMKNN
ncbi:(R)-1-hydroxy-2-aminoethylphosphonate ammonia-lyase [Paenibacillus swuensis]|uniref:(R)-1-hydroxy-2-aminoethylphosphonate ammonia-lyase n=1 Tax=Paenibacillus swuensis TaxID=1178515 RepID=UPI001E325304|nr:aspartate aminotransferase family protein [Paenibacillus swuensis]